MVPRRQSPILVVCLCLVWGVLVEGGCTDRYPPAPPPSEPVVAAAAPSRRLRRLSSREYDNVVRDLLGVQTRPAAGFLPDVYQNGYDNGSVGLAVQSDQVVAYQTAAEALAAGALVSNRVAVLGDCDPDAAGADACLERVLASFAARAYRRPLTDGEAQRLREVFHGEIDQGGDFDRGLRTVLE